MANILSRPSRSLTTAGSRVFRTYHGDEPVELLRSYLAIDDWRERMDLVRDTDSHQYAVKIHSRCNLRPGRRTVFSHDDVFDVKNDKIVLLSKCALSILAPPGSGKFALSQTASDLGLAVYDSDAMLIAHMNKPFGFPDMSRRQHESLCEDQAILFNSLALAPKLPVGNALFLSNLTSGLSSRSWVNFTRSIASRPVISFLVVTPPDVIYQRLLSRYQQKIKQDPSYVMKHRVPTLE